jgi:hypothetical protein
VGIAALPPDWRQTLRTLWRIRDSKKTNGLKPLCRLLEHGLQVANVYKVA